MSRTMRPAVSVFHPSKCLLGNFLLAAGFAAALHAQVAPPAPERVFRGREAEIEEFLRTAPVVKFQDLSLGITKPARAWVAPGGPLASFAWKTVRPGMYRGFWESYKSEIAAYELDKLLDLHMVAPAVERTLNGIDGAAIMWIDGVRMWKDLGETKPATREWNLQVVRTMMFDALIGNGDRNPGNILVDDRWTMYLIDHSRALNRIVRPPVKLAQVDAALWERMRSLNDQTLAAALGRWIDRTAVRAILARRDRMQEQIDGLVAKRGQTSVYIH